MTNHFKYGQGKYGVLPYAGLPEAEKPITPYIPDLMAYLPPYYQELREMVEAQGAISESIGYLKYALEDILNQCFVDTATWGLEYWERELGLAIDRSKPFVRRREIIKAKLRGAGTTTVQMIKDVAIAFSGGEVEVIEYPEESRFEVRFIGTVGIPANMSAFEKMMNEIKPAHLRYGLKFTFTVWSFVKNMTWEDARQKTWGDLRIWE